MTEGLTLRSLHWDCSQSLIKPWGSLAKLNMNSLWVFSWLMVSMVSWIWEGFNRKQTVVRNSFFLSFHQVFLDQWLQNHFKWNHSDFSWCRSFVGASRTVTHHSIACSDNHYWLMITYWLYVAWLQQPIVNCCHKLWNNCNMGFSLVILKLISFINNNNISKWIIKCRQLKWHLVF